MAQNHITVGFICHQLAEDIPQALAIAAKAMGHDVATFKDLLEQGKISAKDFWPRFTEEVFRALSLQVMASAPALPDKGGMHGDDARDD